METVFKIVIITIIFTMALYLSIAVWNKDIMVGKSLINCVKRKIKAPINWIVSKEKDAIYQNGKMVGRIRKAKFKVRNGEIYFEEIYNCNELNIDKEFSFRKYLLKLKHAECSISLNTARPQEGRILESVYCTIIKN